MSTASPAIQQESKARTVFRVVSGNFLEMYDFMVYGYYASAIAKTYFPSGNAFASLMLSLSVFGAGFLMRPVGAIVLGAYIDHHGRRKGLILTLALMALGTLTVATIPGYATIGVLAPILVLLGRLLQGFRRASSWAAYRCICPRSRRRATRASIRRGSRAASRWPWCSPRSSACC